MVEFQEMKLKNSSVYHISFSVFFTLMWILYDEVQLDASYYDEAIKLYEKINGIKS